jgi:DNA-binding response OmpR family regulator
MNPRGKNLRSSSQSKRGTPRKLKGNRVLLFGRFRELALYRAEVLRSQGFAVVTPFSREESIAAVRRGHFDIAILTYTLSSETVQELAELVREYCPECPIIAISTSKKEDREIDPDEIVLADEGPPALLAALRKVTRRH